jgi:hypothetical protein
MAAAISCVPSVEGLIPITAQSQPYMRVALQGPPPLPSGYQKKEFFMSCTALDRPFRFSAEELAELYRNRSGCYSPRAPPPFQ